MSSNATERRPATACSASSGVGGEHRHGPVGVEHEARLRREARAGDGDVDRRPGDVPRGGPRPDGRRAAASRRGGVASSGGRARPARTPPGSARRCARGSAASAPTTPADSATNASTSGIASIGLKRRSKPIVVDPRELIAMPHSEPATWPGNTSTPSGSSSSRRSEWKRPSAPSVAPTARSGRAASPTKSESPVRTSHGSSARVVSITARQQCSGRCPGVWMHAEDDGPDLELVAVRERIVRVRDLRGRVDAHRDAEVERRGGRARRRGRRACASRSSARAGRRAARPRRGSARSRGADRRRPPRPVSSHPTRYEAHPRSSFRTCAKSTARDRSTRLRYPS